ncbi:MAG TPA: TIGR01777 family oxidoreductase [Chitinophagales bacterium]|mgnify:FL=1|nr:TIGR01777 family oxidoreductase [Chitinophagales bacterium]
MNTILIAGATGFVGKSLTRFLLEKGYSIHAFTREKQESTHPNLSYFQWNVSNGFIDENAFENVTTIINLTGTNIGDKRWTKKRKIEILDSRVKSIQLLYDFVQKHNIKIDSFISSSAVGYYGAVTTPEIFTENALNGNDFLADVCKKWEAAALQFSILGVRTIILRKGVIIGKDGGIYQKLAPLAKQGINTALGNGKQFLPWIDIRDLVRLYDFILTHQEISGVYNTVATAQITMNEFSKNIVHSFGKRIFLPNAPIFLLKILFGEMSVMLLEGSKVSNEKLKKTGFSFEFDTIEKSLAGYIF